MNILINYSDIKYKKAQEINEQTGYKFGFDKVIKYNRQSLDSEFINKNISILNMTRGAGYWLWKPYIILKTINESNEDDTIFYCDSGSHFISDINPLINSCKDDDISLFYTHHINKEWTKRDAFYYMKSEAYDVKQIVAAFILCKKRPMTLKIIEEYLFYCQDRRIVTDEPNTCGLDNFSGFKENRHDQSVLTILADKYKINIHKDPSQYGIYTDGIFINDKYQQIIDHTRYGG